MKIGIIGYGNMGSAIAGQIAKKYQVFVADKDESRLREIKEMSVFGNIAELVEISDAVILAVKPQNFEEVLNEIKLSAKGKLFISIAAGIKNSYIENRLGNVRVVRAMPNLGAIRGRSITCICKGKTASQDDMVLANNLFSFIGKVREVEEDKMDAVTAVSGSGPGYFFDAVANRYDEYSKDKETFRNNFINSLVAAATSKEVGLDKELSRVLAEETVIASGLVLESTKKSPEELRDQVTSKGGTTAAALEVLHTGGTLTDAVKAALKRAKELSRG